MSQMNEYSNENIKKWILNGEPIPEDEKRIWNSERCEENGICTHMLIECPVCFKLVYRDDVSVKELENAVKIYEQNKKDKLSRLEMDKTSLDIKFSWNEKYCSCDKYYCRCCVCEEHDLIKCPLKHDY